MSTANKRPVISMGRPSTAAGDNTLVPEADAWVGAGADKSAPTPVPATAPKEKRREKRLTLDIPELLHRRLKSHTVSQGVAMVDELRSLIQERYGDDETAALIRSYYGTP